MSRDTFNAALATAMEAPVTMASTDRWAALCTQLGVECAHQHVLEAVVAYREAWEQATADSIGTSETAMAFAELETALRLAAPGLAPAQAVLAAARACLRPWGLPAAADKPPTAPKAAHAHASGGLPPARAMAVGGAYTVTSGAGTPSLFPELKDIAKQLVNSPGIDAALIYNANGSMLMAHGALVRGTTMIGSFASGKALLPARRSDSSRLRRHLLLRAPLTDGEHHVQIDVVAQRVLLVVVYEPSYVATAAVAVRQGAMKLDAVVTGFWGAWGHEVPPGVQAMLRAITDEDLERLFES